MDFLDQQFLENSLLQWSYFFGVILVGLILRGVISKLVAHLIFLAFKKSAEVVGRNKFDELVKKPLKFIILIIAVFVGSFYLEYPESWNLSPDSAFGLKNLVKDVFYILLVYGIIWLGLKMSDYLGLIFKQKADDTESKLDDQLVPFLIDIIKVVVVVIGILIILSDVFNINVATLVAGLGIGGVALALASKDSLENLLGSFTIFFDQPFKVGDYVHIGGVTGTVEKVGFRSTRIRTPEKTFVTVPNRNMINQELDNFSERTHRRSKFEIGLTYDTSAEQLKSISVDILKVLEENELTTNDPIVRFSSFGASSLNILIVFLAHTKDYADYLALNEEINFKIMEIVNSHNASFAFPSQSIYIENQNKK